MTPTVPTGVQAWQVQATKRPCKAAFCCVAASWRSMGQRSVENGQHGHTVDSTVPCRARRPGLIADQLHIHSLCRRRCWSLLCMCLISVRWTAVCHDATVFTSVVPVDDPVDLRWTPVCSSVVQVFSGQRSATVFSLRKSWPSRGIATAVCNSEQPGHWLLAPGHHGRCHTLT